MKNKKKSARNILNRTGRALVRGTKNVGYGVVGTASGVCMLARGLSSAAYTQGRILVGGFTRAAVAQGRAIVRGQTSFT